MIKKILVVLGAVLPVLLTGCRRDPDEGRQRQGEVVLLLSKVDTAVGVDASGTKAAPADVNDFRVEVLNERGTTVREWARFADMPGSVRFEAGNYTMKASWGDVALQGFELPAYEGSAGFTLAGNDRKGVEVVCRLANVLVSVEATEGLKNYFKDYTVTVHTTGTSVAFEGDEERVAYLEPGTINGEITVTKEDGSTVSAVIPPIADARACEHYHLTVDVGENGSGSLFLQIVPRDVPEETMEVTIPLSELATSLPYFATTGFSAGVPQEIVEESAHTAKALVIAVGGIASFTVEVNSPSLRAAGWPASFDLAAVDDAANASLKEKLLSMGLTWSPRIRNSQMAEVDFSGAVPYMYADKKGALDNALVFQVTDVYGKQSDRTGLVYRVTLPEFSIVRATDLAPEVRSQVTVQVTSGDVAKVTGLQYYDWVWKDADARLVSAEGNECTFEADLPFTTETKQVRIRAVYGANKRTSAEAAVNVVLPNFGVSVTDVTAVSAKMVIAAPAEGYDMSRLQFGYVDQSRFDASGRRGLWVPFEPSEITVTTPSPDRMEVQVGGLVPSERYEMGVVYMDAFRFTDTFTAADGFTFEEWTTVNTFSGLQSGGTYGKKTLWWWSDVTDHVDLTVSDPAGWETVNARTASKNSSPQNTWLVVPSTLPENGGHAGRCARMRNVGWDESTNVPNNGETEKGNLDFPILKKNTAGRIERTLNLRSNPTGLRFWYKFVAGGSKDQDAGTVQAFALDASNAVLASYTDLKFTTGVPDWTQGTLQFKGGLPKGTARLRILCASSVELGDQGENYFSLVYNKNSNPCTATGSELWIDDIQLVY